MQFLDVGDLLVALLIGFDLLDQKVGVGVKSQTLREDFQPVDVAFLGVEGGPVTIADGL